jgi:hypothetical protein
MTIRLIPEEVLLSREEEVRHLIASVASMYAIDVEDPVHGPAFRHFLLFCHWPSLLAGSFPDLDTATVFYNKYFWFMRFVRLYALAYGPDAGMEQQAFQLLEAAEFEIDWSVIEEIESEVAMDLDELGP